MNRLRDWSPWLLAAVASALLVANVAGLFVQPTRHPLALGRFEHKQGLTMASAAEVRKRLDAQKPSASEEYLRLATEIIASGIHHYWPLEHEYDPNVTLQVHENWAIAVLGWTENVLVSLGFLDRFRFALLERFDRDDILEKGVGICSQASLALAAHLRDTGISAHLVGLDGHVVVATIIGAEDYLLDADYNVVMQASLQIVEQTPALVEKAYVTAGYSRELAGDIASIYGPDGNYVGGATSYHPTHAMLYASLGFVKWGLPILALVGSILLIRRMQMPR